MSEFLSNVKMLRERARQHLEQGTVTTGYEADREQVSVLTPQTDAALEVWRCERRETLARQLVANVETRLNWLESNPIEISQRQRGYHTNPHVQASAVRTALPGDLRR